MNLLDLIIKITTQDDASDKVDDVSKNAIGKLIEAAKKAAKALAAMWGVKKVIDFGKAAFDAYAEYEQLVGGIQKLYGNANMSLEEYAASVGKTVDEVSAEYERNAQAEADMLSYASDAWRTAGMDMNTYMQNATSMSASLINSLGGDTVKAAEMTDVAMRAISDNVNTFGSDMESVTNAFMGFSRQNYTMLDNLKLGYAGTKEGMEQLIADANEWAAANGLAADLTIDSYADVVQAIEYVQQKQGIAGTTAREALSTLEGSMNAFQMAWQNLVAEFGKPDADIAKRIGDMFTAVFGVGGEGGVLKNVVTEVGVIGNNMVEALKNGLTFAADWVLNNGPSLLRNAFSEAFTAIGNLANEFDLGTFDLQKLIDSEEVSAALEKLGEFGTEIMEVVTTWGPHLIGAVSSLWGSVVSYVQENAPVLMETLGNLLNDVVSWIVENGPTIAGAVAEDVMSSLEEMTSHWPEFVDAIAEVIGNIVKWIIDNGPTILSAAGEWIANVGKAIMEHGPTMLGNIAETVGKVLGYIIGAAADMLSAGIEFVGGLLDGSTEEGEAVRQWFADLPSKLLSALGDVGSLLWDAGSSIISGLWEGLKSAWGNVTEWVGGLGSWIAEHKGPLDYDRKLLVPAGNAIMSGFGKSLEDSFDRNVAPFVESLADEISGNVTLGATADYNGIGASGAVVNNYYIDGNLVAADAVLSAALDTVAQRVSGRRRMGVAYGANTA